MVPTTPGKPTTPRNKFDAFGLMRPVETLWVILETADDADHTSKLHNCSFPVAYYRNANSTCAFGGTLISIN